MKEKINKICKKIHSDAGDAILVQTIVAAFTILFFAAITFDLTKGAAVKDDYTAKAQQASQISIQSIQSDGSLNWNAASKFTRSYEELRGIDRADSKRKCSTHDFGNGATASPYYTFTLKTGRGNTVNDSVSWTTSNPYDTNSAPQLKNDAKYRVINVEVHDTVPNFFLNSFGIPCQGIGANVSAISFGSQSDLK